MRDDNDGEVIKTAEECPVCVWVLPLHVESCSMSKQMCFPRLQMARANEPLAALRSTSPVEELSNRLAILLHSRILAIVVDR